MNRLLLVALLCAVVGVLFGSSLVDRVLFFSAPVRVSSLDLEDEVVTLQNADAIADIDLSGWVLESTVGGGQKYVFPPNYVLKAFGHQRVLDRADAQRHPVCP
ncbi:intermediate filament [Balamuthia mandrillaris]